MSLSKCLRQSSARGRREGFTRLEKKRPKGSPKKEKENQNEAKGNQKGAQKPKGCQKGAKGCQKGAAGRPKWIQKSPWAPRSILEAKSGCRQRVFGSHFWTIFHQKGDQKSMQKQMSKNMNFNQKATPKGCRNRCQNASKINARTGIEKDQGNHQKSCFSEE